MRKATKTNQKFWVPFFGKNPRLSSLVATDLHSHTLADVVGKKYDFLTGRKTG